MRVCVFVKRIQRTVNTTTKRKSIEFSKEREQNIPFKRNSDGDSVLCLRAKLNAETSTFFLFVLCAPGRVKVSNTVVSKHDPVFFDIFFLLFSFLSE